MEVERNSQIDAYSQIEACPKLWAVGGGKGGIGKSTVSILLAFWLARMGKRTILVDLDLGGANLHTLMGIKSPPKTLNDFVTRRIDSLEEVCIETDIKISVLSAVPATSSHWPIPMWPRKPKLFSTSANWMPIIL
jgi:flagellar biosynthesis protein FlhG